MTVTQPNGKTRITARQYTKAKKTVNEAKQQAKLVQAWEEATRQIGNQQVEAITINSNGTIRIELIVGPAEG